MLPGPLDLPSLVVCPRLLSSVSPAAFLSLPSLLSLAHVLEIEGQVFPSPSGAMVEDWDLVMNLNLQGMNFSESSEENSLELLEEMDLETILGCFVSFQHHLVVVAEVVEPEEAGQLGEDAHLGHPVPVRHRLPFHPPTFSLDAFFFRPSSLEFPLVLLPHALLLPSCTLGLGKEAL